MLDAIPACPSPGARPFYDDTQPYGERMSNMIQSNPDVNSPPLFTFADLSNCGYVAALALDPEANLEITSMTDARQSHRCT